MRITDIKRQNRDGYYSVFLDDEFRFSLTDLALSSGGLRVGRELTEADVEAWRKQSGESKALGYGYRYLASRARSASELGSYLRRKGFEPTEIEYVTKRLMEERLISDEQFAKDWVDMRQRTSPRSKQRLTAELRKKGLSTENIDEALVVVAGDQIITIARIVENKRLRDKYKNEPSKLVAYLARQGFGYSDITNAINLLNIGDPDEMEQ